jgi:hypothetical protein
MCQYSERMSWIFNQYWLSKRRDPAACTKVGGTLKTPLWEKSAPTDCDQMMKQVGGTGTGRLLETPALPMNPDSPRLETTSALGLKRGSKIGIGVVASAAFLFCLFLGVFFWHRRKRNMQLKGADSSPLSDGIIPKAELGDTSYHSEMDSTRAERAILDSKTIVEMDGDTGVVELPTSPSELEASHSLNEIPRANDPNR